MPEGLWKISHTGQSMMHPVAPNALTSGRGRNRRVELVFVVEGAADDEIPKAYEEGPRVGRRGFPQSVFVGLSPELNANTRKGAALGLGLTAGVDINDMLAAGLTVMPSHDLDNISAFEARAFFRWYVPYLTWNVPFLKGSFAQADAGVAYGSQKNFNSYVAPLFGLSGGWSIPLDARWYLEPTARFGYPFMWGVGCAVGMNFELK